jgi:hypothetical protein
MRRVDGPDPVRVSVGTPASEGVVWDDLNAPETPDGGTAKREAHPGRPTSSSRPGASARSVPRRCSPGRGREVDAVPALPFEEELVLAFLQREAAVDA